MKETNSLFKCNKACGVEVKLQLIGIQMHPYMNMSKKNKFKPVEFAKRISNTNNEICYHLFEMFKKYFTYKIQDTFKKYFKLHLLFR